MTCSLCKGTGNLFHWTDGRPEIWQCPKCGGAGASIVYGPALIGPGARRKP